LSGAQPLFEPSGELLGRRLTGRFGERIELEQKIDIRRCVPESDDTVAYFCYDDPLARPYRTDGEDFYRTSLAAIRLIFTVPHEPTGDNNHQKCQT